MTMTADNETASDAGLKDGRVVAIAGPVVDVEFPPDALPEINWALTFEIEVEGKTTEIVAEVAQHIGESRVRAIAMKPTDGLRRGAPVKNTGAGIKVPVGSGTLGHVFNVIVISRITSAPAPSMFCKGAKTEEATLPVVIPARWPLRLEESSLKRGR